jgi:hypothetical protein
MTHKSESRYLVVFVNTLSIIGLCGALSFAWPVGWDSYILLFVSAVSSVPIIFALLTIVGKVPAFVSAIVMINSVSYVMAVHDVFHKRQSKMWIYVCVSTLFVFVYRHYLQKYRTEEGE